MGYTSHDTQAIVQRIDGDMKCVTRAVREADPHLRALVLTGGFARGEGTVRDGVPQNDYDFVAIRAVGRTRTSYASLRVDLEKRLGIHIDLAPVPAWRLPWTERSIFWYETALRGRTLWGHDFLPKIRIRRPGQIRRTEGLRLLVNRAAGLLLSTGEQDAHAIRIQAAKGLLAALDSAMLCQGQFAPTQRERWAARPICDDTEASPRGRWNSWAYRFKVDGCDSAPPDAHSAWRAARTAILAAVPGALEHAGFANLQQYARSDRMLERVIYGLRARTVPGARRLVLNPTGRIRVATLALLAATPQRIIGRREAESCLAGISRIGPDPVLTLAGLRAASLQ